MISRGIAAMLLVASACPVSAQSLPPCALTGSMTMSIGGKPALRLSDVVKCPPGSYEVIPTVTIDGQPMVHFKLHPVGKMRCIPRTDPTVFAESEAPAVLDDSSCSTH